MSATPVAPLTAVFPPTCPRCGNRAQWQVGTAAVACDVHLARVLRGVISASDRFTPIAPELIGGVQ